MNWMNDQVAAGAKDVNAYGMRLASARPWHAIFAVHDLSRLLG